VKPVARLKFAWRKGTGPWQDAQQVDHFFY